MAAVRARKMTRHFTDQPVEVGVLDELLSAALRAPSAGFAQGVELLVLTSPSSRALFWESIGDQIWRQTSASAAGLMPAPVLIVPLASARSYLDRYSRDDKVNSSLYQKEAEAWPVPYWLIDAGFAAMTILLGAADVGLGALFFQLQGREANLCNQFSIPPDYEPIGAIALGYPAAHPLNRSRAVRRSLHEVTHREHW